MPQQPLSRVRPKARVYGSPDALDRRPELAHLFALALANWAQIEVSLITVLTTVLGASSGVATAMVQTLRSSQTQMQVIEAAGKAALKDPQLEIFEAIMNIARRVNKKRNLLVHNTWGFADELPDALLRVDVDASVQVMVNLERQLREGPPPLSTEDPDLELDPEQVWVYRKVDFEEIISEMKSLLLYITLMHHFAGGLPRSDAISKILAREPLLQTELLRVRESR